MQTHVDNSFGNSLAFTMNNTYGEPCMASCIAHEIDGGEDGFWPQVMAAYVAAILLGMTQGSVQL